MKDGKLAEGNYQRVGKYSVHVHEFEDTCLDLMESLDDDTVLVIDEIGKMEMLSQRFVTFIENLIKSPKAFKVIATVPIKNQIDLVRAIKEHPKTELFHITRMNRDIVYESLLRSAVKLLT